MSSRWKERNAKTRKDSRYEEENPCQSEEDALARDRQLCLGQWKWRGKRLEAAARNSVEEKGEQKDK